ncbi:hypothetical protein [Haloarchaeobius sp. HME9146]|uniref:hypothetical protein n=1 Tax=unclassified Haloarchaeobius TaxID=2614452 RepID=UPI0021C0A48A|nr:hypothetical protein [Haloarchaeobius sp. HME9146]MCT9095646.1 hypothetical protein [Haloarchaeobius sp. HME9146]
MSQTHETPTDEEIRNALSAAERAIEAADYDGVERASLRLLSLARRGRREHVTETAGATAD